MRTAWDASLSLLYRATASCSVPPVEAYCTLVMSLFQSLIFFHLFLSVFNVLLVLSGVATIIYKFSSRYS